VDCVVIIFIYFTTLFAAFRPEQGQRFIIHVCSLSFTPPQCAKHSGRNIFPTHLSLSDCFCCLLCLDIKFVGYFTSF
jgi:hypothetical protein